MLHCAQNDARDVTARVAEEMVCQACALTVGKSGCSAGWLADGLTFAQLPLCAT